MRSEMGEELAALCRLHPYDLPGARHGYREPEMRKRLEEAQVDVAFICLSNESLALIQAATLREILRDTVHIIVRVKEEDAGFGALLQPPAAGGLGRFIRPVGTHDQVFDIAKSMNPMIELLAQVLHHDYLLLTARKIRRTKESGDEAKVKELRAKKAYVPWRKLAEDLKESNRMLAVRLRKHLTIPGSNRRFMIRFAPHELLQPDKMFRLSEAEIEALAMQEHDEWMAAMKSLGWRKGHGANPHASDPERKLNPNLVPWTELDEGMKDYDRNIIRRLPYYFAKADYEIVECS
jgi:hypothetical protein